MKNSFLSLFVIFIMISLFSCDYNHTKKVVVIRDTHCDDGSVLSCNSPQPDCAPLDIPAVQNGCWLCVDKETCSEWEPPVQCSDDSSCSADEYCAPCGGSSCNGCTDCIQACVPHSCQTETQLTCNLLRPDCGAGNIAVIKDGCWQCVDFNTCLPVRDSHCDDGTVPVCEMMEPRCEDYEILAYQNECYRCVNPSTCLPWGVAECESDIGCPAEKYCDMCGSSSCPDCDDCVAVCIEHSCETQSDDELLCYAMRPDCGAGNVGIIRDGCWVCVSLSDCSELEYSNN